MQGGTYIAKLFWWFSENIEVVTAGNGDVYT